MKLGLGRLNGGAPQFCSSVPIATDGVVVCPICFETVPDDMAIQFDDGTDISNATCVDTTGA